MEALVFDLLELFEGDERERERHDGKQPPRGRIRSLFGRLTAMFDDDKDERSDTQGRRDRRSRERGFDWD